jgi:PAS domain S-box-containing protein
MIGTVIDLTEEKEAADKLLSVQTELMQIKEFVFLAESLPQLVWTTDKNGDVDYFNQNWFSFTGQSKKEALAWGWASMIHHDDLNQTLELWRRALREENLFQAEYRIQKYDGTFRWFLGKGVPMKDENNKIKKWIGTCTDIHDLKTYEEVLLKSNNELSKTNKDLDNFVYTASHDLKAPVANLEGLLNMMKKKVGNEIESEGKNILNLMETSVNRFKSTIHDLTEITKINKKIQEDIQEVSFEEAVKEVLEDLRTTIHETGAEFKYDFRVSQIYFSKINFRSIISNLLGNAIKYRSPDRKPSIEIATHQEGRWCILTVKDNGIGFDITKKDKVFAMFRRLHDHVEGTGLGLYIVKRIIEDAGGKIEADSKIGEGSLFKLYFPI